MKKAILSDGWINGLSITFALTLVFAGLVSVNSFAADVNWNGDGDGSSWENGANWDSDEVPGTTQADYIYINGDATVDLDSASWTYFEDNSLLSGGATGDYEGAEHYEVGFSKADTGTQTVNYDFGDANTVNHTSSDYHINGGRGGHDSTLNVDSGNVEFGDNLRIGTGAGGTGTVNLSGGSITTTSNGLLIGNPDTDSGVGNLNLTGGSLQTRHDVVFRKGTFYVEGNAPSNIGIGASSTDGYWEQQAGATLDLAIDDSGTGLTQITVADNGGAGTSATFDSGSLLDVSFLNSKITGTWTVMEVENGDITDNGLGFASGVDEDIWSFNVDNSGSNGELYVTAVPEPGSLAMLLFGAACLFTGRRRCRRR